MKLEEAIKEILQDLQELKNISQYREKQEIETLSKKILELYKTVLQEIDHLQKENEKLTRARNWYFEHTANQIATPEMLDKILKDKYISKDKIRELFEEICKQYGEYEKQYGDDLYKVPSVALVDFQRIIGAKNVLQDLLKEE